METDTRTFSNTQILTGQLPQWEGIEFEPLARSAPWPPFWSSSVTFLLFLVAITVALIATPFPLAAYITALASGLVLFALAQWHNFAEHKRRGVALREKDIAFKRGLFWRQHTMLPFNRVQHIEIHQGPIERKLGLSSLRLYTAGGSGVDLQISGLEQGRADRMKQLILEKTTNEEPEA